MTINYSFLRPLKAADLKRLYSSSFEKKENLKVEVYKNATILPLRRFEGDNLLFGRGGVVSETGEYVNLSAINGRIQFPYEYSNRSYIDENVVYCGYLVNQWGHFLIEAVARLWYFLKKDDDSIDHYVFFLQSEEKREVLGNYREFFELLGIWNKLSFINKPTQYKKIIVPELGYNRNIDFTEEFKNIFIKVSNNVFSKKDSTTTSADYSKVFLSRSKMKGVKRKEFGLEIIDDYFEKNNYKVLYPERMSLSSLIFYMNKADEIAMFSGSVHHNVLFAKDEKKIILIEKNIINNEIQVDINRMKNLSVDYIDANIPIYSVHIGCGPFIMAYNKFLEQYTIKRNMIPANSKYCNSKYLKKLFKNYMRCYDNTYRFQWFMEDWFIEHTDMLREGYNEGFQYFGEFLSGHKAFLLRHYFSIHLWKHKLRKIALFFYKKHHK